MLQGLRMSEFNGLAGQSQGLRRNQSLPQDCKESLLSVIENQIIPRLLNVQQFFPDKAKALASQEPVAEQPEFLEFTHIA
jgi:hypothetical protein